MLQENIEQYKEVFLKARQDFQLVIQVRAVLGLRGLID
jgi:hypothetical protein